MEAAEARSEIYSTCFNGMLRFLQEQLKEEIMKTFLLIVCKINKINH